MAIYVSKQGVYYFNLLLGKGPFKDDSLVLEIGSDDDFRSFTRIYFAAFVLTGVALAATLFTLFDAFTRLQIGAKPYLVICMVVMLVTGVATAISLYRHKAAVIDLNQCRAEILVSRLLYAYLTTLSFGTVFAAWLAIHNGVRYGSIKIALALLISAGTFVAHRWVKWELPISTER